MGTTDRMRLGGEKVETEEKATPNLNRFTPNTSQA